jgi:FkbH-like protein
MRFWATADDDRYLRPDEFVTHRINWDAKSANVAAILDELGVVPDAALFVDDSAVERAEVAARFPQLRMLGDDIAGVRRALLTDPCLQPNVISAEARGRTASTQARIARDAARTAAADPGEFLRSLEIRMHVARISSELHADRVIELSRRTNQFNTTLIRYDAAVLAALRVDPAASVWALAVRDRFASYGLVGICVVRDDEIENISISCRAIGLHVDQPFLAAVLAEARLFDRRIAGRVIDGERNHPGRGVFRDAGFADLGGGTFVREARPDRPAIDRSIYTLVVTSEAELTRLD